MENTSVIISFAVLKNISYVAAFVAFSTYLNISAESIAILSGLIIIDVITGMLKAAKVYGPHSIQSSRLSSGVLAKLLLILVPITLAFAGKGVGLNIGALAQASIGVLVLSEAYSIIGNIHSATTGKVKQEFDAVAWILTQLRKMLERATVGDPDK